MKKLYVIFLVLLMGITHIYAFTWDDCIDRYNKAKQFKQNTVLFYNYLRSTKSCLVKFKNILAQNPDPEFTVKAMDNNILMLEKYIHELVPKYKFPKNNLEQIPKYLNLSSSKPILNKEYSYFKKFKNCNAIHAKNKIYTAKHCNIKNSIHIKNDLSYIKTNKISKLQIAPLDLNKKGSFKYYSMSKEGMFFSSLLKEKNCSFKKTNNILNGQNKTLDLSDLEKKEIIKSSCLAIPSNSGGGVFQGDKLVAIISKTVFVDERFSYSIIEPIMHIIE